MPFRLCWKLWFFFAVYFIGKCCSSDHTNVPLESTLAMIAVSNVQLPSNASKIIRGRITTDVVLPCDAYKEKGSSSLSWWHCGSKRKQIGYYENAGKAVTDWTRNNSYRVLETGKLLLNNVRRELVDRYECVVLHKNGETATSDVYFRLDFSFWYDQRWNSLFYGSCLSSLVFCAASFLLNVIWIICRKVILWWINRTERISRVRSMVEAMEKYRQRQIENLHDTYHRRITTIRDNYHQQVDQLRNSYANQVGRFRGYRQAQMENVTQHLDNIRENYNQQLTRIREYGSRRTEQLWENYERQLNRMRLFTLQQRLKLMRQYKVKQRYINKLLEAISDSNNPEVIQKREAEIRAALNLPDDLAFPHPTISRSSSYYSLPEFVIEDDLLDPNLPSTSSKNDGVSAALNNISTFKGGTPSTTSHNRLNFHHHHHQPHNYHTAVIRLQPRGDKEGTGSALGSGAGILQNDTVRNIETFSPRIRLESSNFSSIKQASSSKDYQYIELANNAACTNDLEEQRHLLSKSDAPNM